MSQAEVEPTDDEDWAEAHWLELRLDSLRRRYKRVFAHYLRETNITAERTLVVTAIMYYGPLTQKELGSVLHKHKAAVSALIKSMEKDGLIERTVNPDDSRSHRINLTRAGRKVFEIVDEIVLEVRRELIANISAEDLDHAQAVLSVMEANLVTLAESRGLPFEPH